MGTSPIVPTTVEGIKRLAKSYTKRLGLPHHEALDRASGDAGFASYAIALRAILRPANNNGPEVPSKHRGRTTLLTLARGPAVAREGQRPRPAELAQHV